MPMQVRQLDLQQSVQGDPKSPSADLMFYVDGVNPESDTLDDVIVAVLAEAPGFVTFRVPNNNGITPAYFPAVIYRQSVSPAYISPTQATALVKYGLMDAVPHESQGGEKPGDKGEGELCGPEFSFDTQGGTSHIVQSLNTRWKNKANLFVNNNAPDNAKSIGYSDGKIEGCDIVTGSIKWSFTVKGVPVTPSYIEKLSQMTGTINLNGDIGDEPFMGFEPYSTLFIGASGNFRAGDGWVVTYNFMTGKNRTEVYFGSGDDQVRFDNVYAHDYVWFTYKEVSRDGFTLQVPTAGYVEEVYEGSDFNELFTP